jgi:hypothetical protein
LLFVQPTIRTLPNNYFQLSNSLKLLLILTYRYLQNGFGTKVNSSRKQRKERKNKAKYARGKKKKEIMKGGAAKK